jgi:hypothetical protein
VATKTINSVANFWSPQWATKTFDHQLLIAIIGYPNKITKNCPKYLVVRSRVAIHPISLKKLVVARLFFEQCPKNSVINLGN